MTDYRTAMCTREEHEMRVHFEEAMKVRSEVFSEFKESAEKVLKEMIDRLAPDPEDSCRINGALEMAGELQLVDEAYWRNKFDICPGPRWRSYVDWEYVQEDGQWKWRQKEKHGVEEVRRGEVMANGSANTTNQANLLKTKYQGTAAAKKGKKGGKGKKGC